MSKTRTKAAPRVVVFAGPNGAGKSTHADAIVASLRINTFVNADYIARGLSGLNADQVAIQAGRIMLTRLKDLAAAKHDFATAKATLLATQQGDNLQIKEPKLWLKLQNLIKTA